MQRLVVLAVMATVLLSGCLGIDILPPEEQRDGVLWSVRADRLSPETDVATEQVVEYRTFNASEQKVLRSAIGRSGYEVCQDETVVSDALTSVVRTYIREDGPRFLSYDGAVYEIRVSRDQGAC